MIVKKQIINYLRKIYMKAFASVCMNQDITQTQNINLEQNLWQNFGE